MAEIEADEVPVAEQASVVCAADLQKNEEDDSDKQEKGCQQGPGFASSCRTFDLRLCEFRMALLNGSVNRVLRPAATK